MVTKKTLIGCLIAVFVCLALSVACAIIKKFDVVTTILLGIVTLIAIIVSVVSWKELVEQKRND